MSQPLPGGATGKELAKTLAADELVLGYASGKAGVLLVATDRRVLIVKAGVAATGSYFSKQTFSFVYPQITNVELKTGMLDGYVEISTPGAQHQQRGRVGQLRSDNTVPFNKGSEKQFRAVVDLIRSHLYSTPNNAPTNNAPTNNAPTNNAPTNNAPTNNAPTNNAPTNNAPTAQATANAPDIPGQIAALAKLHDSGVLTDAEFEAKKAELLSRM